MFDANTLIRQLGTALPMLGAKDLVASENGLQFKIQGCQRGNKVRITLDPSDTYTVELWKVRGLDFKQIGDQSFVHADQLHGALKALTGLDTRL
jgi:hypothetical protein